MARASPRTSSTPCSSASIAAPRDATASRARASAWPSPASWPAAGAATSPWPTMPRAGPWPSSPSRGTWPRLNRGPSTVRTMRRRAALLWTLAAIAGVFLAAGVTLAASQLSRVQVGLSSEPLQAGEALAPTPTATPKPQTKPKPRRRTKPKPTPTATPTAVPTVDDNGGSSGGHGADDAGGGDDHGSGGHGADD